MYVRLFKTPLALSAVVMVAISTSANGATLTPTIYDGTVTSGYAIGNVTDGYRPAPSTSVPPTQEPNAINTLSGPGTASAGTVALAGTYKATLTLGSTGPTLSSVLSQSPTLSTQCCSNDQGATAYGDIQYQIEASGPSDTALLDLQAVGTTNWADEAGYNRDAMFITLQWGSSDNPTQLVNQKTYYYGSSFSLDDTLALPTDIPISVRLQTYLLMAEGTPGTETQSLTALFTIDPNMVNACQYSLATSSGITQSISSVPIPSAFSMFSVALVGLAGIGVNSGRRASTS